jgi:ABC-type transporter Mla subunit MlaD
VFNPPELPWDGHLRFTLDALDFGQLDSAAGVELNGVEVGKVAGLREAGERQLVQLEVERRYASLLHADASAAIRPHGLLGTKFVDLSGGARGQMQSGGVVPPSRVHVTTDLDQVLNALQPDVRQDLQLLIVELGRASNDRGTDLNDTLGALSHASNDLSTVTATLARRDQDLADIVSSSERLNPGTSSSRRWTPSFATPTASWAAWPR